MSQPPAFPQFARLPFEIQDEIWKATLDLPRIVEILRVEASGSFGDLSLNLPRETWYSPCHPPEVLHVCKRSRHVANLFGPVPITFKRSVGPVDANDRHTESEQTSGGTLFDFKQDTLCLSLKSPH